MKYNFVVYVLVVVVLLFTAIALVIFSGGDGEVVAPTQPPPDSISPDMQESEKETVVGKSAQLDSPVKIIPLWAILLLFLSIASSAGAVFVAYLFYRWRLSIESTGALVPEKWASVLERTIQESNATAQGLKALEDLQVKVAKNVEDSVGRIQKSQEENLASLMTFQKALDKKDDEIDRLKSGYDAKILQRFLTRLVDLHISIVDLSSKEKIGQRELANVALMIQDNLENAGVEMFAPDIDTDFSALGKSVDPGGGTIPTDDPKKDGYIAEVVSPGYSMTSDGGSTVLRAARIKYFIFEKAAK